MNYIDGDFCPTRVDFSDDNPSTGESLGMFPRTDEEELKGAILAAKRAQKKWRNVSKEDRAALFSKLYKLIKRDCDKIAEVISMETGKTLEESFKEVTEAIDFCQHISLIPWMRDKNDIKIVSKNSYTTRKPKGVVAVISPCNLPVYIGSIWLSASAIIKGNTVIHKPSELAPYSAQILTQLYDEAGFPSGVYNLVHGDGIVGYNLVRSDVDCVLFTGSSEVGLTIQKHCAENFSKSCKVKCGGKPVIVLFEDGKQDIALESILGSFKLSGQRCNYSNQVLIQRSIFDVFVSELLLEIEKKVTTGDPFDEQSYFYGPIISKEKFYKVKGYNRMVREDEHAVILLDAAAVVPKKNCNFLGPFVYKAEWADKPYLKQEIFGPHLSLIPFDDIDNALCICNDIERRLIVEVFTEDSSTITKFINECDTEMILFDKSSSLNSLEEIFFSVTEEMRVTMHESLEL